MSADSQIETASPPGQVVPSSDLAAVKAERAARQAKREATAAAEAARLELEAERQALANEVAIDEAVDKYGAIDVAIGIVTTRAGGVVIVRKPNHMHYRKFIESKTGKSVEDAEALIRSCLVYPDKPTFSALLEDLPGLIDAIATKACALAGSKVAEAAGK